MSSASVVFVVNALGQLITYVVQAVLARLIGAESYGIYVYAYSWLPLLLIPALLGFDTALLRFIPSYISLERWNYAFGVYRFSRQFVAFSSIAIAILTGTLTVYLQLDLSLTLTLLVASASLPLWSQFSLLHAALQAFNNVVLAQILQVVVKPTILILIVGIFYLVSSGLIGSVAVMTAHLLTLCILSAVGYYSVKNLFHRVSESFNPLYEWKMWTRVSLPLAFVSGMRVLLNTIDIILIGILLSPMDAGIYSVASRVAHLLAFGLSSSNSVVSPRIAELHTRKNYKQLQQVVTTSSWFSTIATVIIGLIIFFSSEFLLGVFGEKFITGRTVLYILSIAQIINSMTGPVGRLLNMTGYQDVNLRILVTVVTLNCIFNYPAILLWGVSGAAIVTATLSIIKNIWTWFEVKRRLNINSSIINLNLQRM